MATNTNQQQNSNQQFSTSVPTQNANSSISSSNLSEQSKQQKQQKQQESKQKYGTMTAKFDANNDYK